MCEARAVGKTTVYLPPELRRSLRAAAIRQRRPQAELVREALTDYLSKLQRPRLPWIGMGEDDEVSGATSEDYIRSSWNRD
jgi:predicted transcriptional regulator